MLTEHAKRCLKALTIIAEAYDDMAASAPPPSTESELDQDTCLNGAAVVALNMQSKWLRDHLGEPENDPEWNGGKTREQLIAAFRESASIIRTVIDKHHNDTIPGGWNDPTREQTLHELVKEPHRTLAQMIRCVEARKMAYMCDRLIDRRAVADADE